MWMIMDRRPCCSRFDTDHSFFPWHLTELAPSEHLQVESSIWLPLNVASNGNASSSSQAVGVTKIAKSVIAPLAQQHVSVFMLSTYQTDFILVSVLLKTFAEICWISSYPWEAFSLHGLNPIKQNRPPCLHLELKSFLTELTASENWLMYYMSRSKWAKMFNNMANHCVSRNINGLLADWTV